jgi:chromosome partitioning protein
MRKIIINSQKGGSGKTMLVAHIAVEAERSGDGETYLIDTDPQGTLTTWHECRKAEAPRRVEVPLNKMRENLQLLEQHGAEWCFIDTAPNRTDDNATLFQLADLVLVPVRPSPSDLWAVAATVKLLHQTQTPFLFVLTQAKRNANITAQAVAALSHHGAVAQTLIADRVAYSAAMTDGRTAQELEPKSACAVEIAELWKNIKTCLHANIQKPNDERVKSYA